MKKYTLKIGWLYPELMSTYGDRGNITVLKKRCDWRGINVEVVNIDQNFTNEDFKNIDLLFGGGAQDKEQGLVIDDLHKKGIQLKRLVENDIPCLFVCGSPQLFGKYYEPSVGKRIEGLGIFNMTSVHPGPKKERLIGNVIARVNWNNLNTNVITNKDKLSMIKETAMSPLAHHHDTLLVGFENHGGRTYLGKNALPFAKIIKGYGNNGEDGTEGVIYKNAIGSYLHGPFLPKNPEVADWLIKKALEIKYNEKIELETIDDSLSEKAKSMIAERLGVKL